MLKLEYPYLPGGILLEILGLGVPPGSSNPDPISDQKCHFQSWSLKSIPVFRPGGGHKTQHNIFR